MRENVHEFNSKTIKFQGQLIVILGDLKKMRLKHDRKAKFQIQIRQSIFIVLINFFFIVLIYHDVEDREKTRGEYIQQHIHFISSCLIGKLFAVLQWYKT